MEKSAKKIKNGTLELVKKAAAIMAEKKASNPVLLDVRKDSSLTDYYLVISGSSTPHLKALADEVQHVFKADKLFCHRRSGAPDSGWLVLDYVDFVIHILSPDVRDYYAIEDLWKDAKRLDL